MTDDERFAKLTTGALMKTRKGCEARLRWLWDHQSADMWWLCWYLRVSDTNDLGSAIYRKSSAVHRSYLKRKKAKLL